MSQNLGFQHAVNMTLSSQKPNQENDNTSTKENILAKASIEADNPFLNTYAGQIAQFILEGNYDSAIGLYDFILEHGKHIEPPKSYYMFWDNGGEYSDHTILLYEIPISIPAHEAKLFLEKADDPRSSWQPFVISIHNSIAFCNDEKGNPQIGLCDLNTSPAFAHLRVTLDPRGGQSEDKRTFENAWKYVTLEIAKHHLAYEDPSYEHWVEAVQHNYHLNRKLLKRFIETGVKPTWSEYVDGAKSY